MERSYDTFIPPTLNATLPPRCPWCVWTYLVPWLDRSHWRCNSCGRHWRLDHDGIHPPFD
jgi:hypothetical protein